MHISKSNLNTFLACPRKFAYIYLENLKPETTEAMQRGLDVHQFCGQFYDMLTFNNQHFTIDESFVDLFLAQCSEEAQRQISNFLAFEMKRWSICKQLCPTNPKKLFIPLLRESKFFADSINQVTIIDRMDLRLDGNYTLVEIKSGKFLNKDWKKTELRRELAFEKTTCEASPEFQKKFPNEIVDFVIYFPSSNDIMMENFNGRTLGALRKSIEKMKQAIEDKDFPCNVAYHCRFCPFSLTCDFSFN